MQERVQLIERNWLEQVRIEARLAGQVAVRFIVKASQRDQQHPIQPDLVTQSASDD